jgi:regulator of protease activity HflC (stomatin/prohibitin superfamily)
MPKLDWDTEFTDILPTSPAGVCSSACCLIVNFILIILFFPCTVTQLGQFKIALVRNKVTGYVDLDNPYEPGRYWIGFWKEFIEFPSTLNTIEFSEEKPEEGVQHLTVMKSRDKDGKRVLLDISIQYRLRKEDLGRIYRDMLVGYEDIYISELRDSLAKAANTFEIEDSWNDYTAVVDKLTAKCKEVLANRFAECWGLQLWGVTLTTKYEAKLILTQVRKQAMKTELATKNQAEVRAKTQVLLAEYRKNVTILRSGGEAASYVIKRKAFATAQANVVSAQAKSLQIVRDIVCPDYARGYASGNNLTAQTCVAPGWVMDSKQLVSYQKMTLLKHHNASHLIYNLKGGVHPQPVNVVASRNMMNGKARRLLHGTKRQDKEHEL